MDSRSASTPPTFRPCPTVASDALRTSAERQGVLRCSDDHGLVPAVEDDRLRLALLASDDGYGVRGPGGPQVERASLGRIAKSDDLPTAERPHPFVDDLPVLAQHRRQARD